MRMAGARTAQLGTEWTLVLRASVDSIAVSVFGGFVARWIIYLLASIDTVGVSAFGGFFSMSLQALEGLPLEVHSDSDINRRCC